MKINFNTLLLLIVLLFFQNKVRSQKPNYSGTWKINLQKTTFEANWAKGLTEGVFTIIQTGNDFKWSRYFIINGKKKKLKLHLVADGKVRRKKFFLLKTKLEWMAAALKAHIFRNGFSDVVDYQFGDTNNELIIDEVFVGRPQDYHNHYVLDRVDNKLILLTHKPVELLNSY